MKSEIVNRMNWTCNKCRATNSEVNDFCTNCRAPQYANGGCLKTIVILSIVAAFLAIFAVKCLDIKGRKKLPGGSPRAGLVRSKGEDREEEVDEKEKNNWPVPQV